MNKEDMNPNLSELTPKMGPSLEETIDFRHLIYLFLENKLLILLVTLISTILAMSYTAIKTPEYEANTLIKIESRHSGGMNILSRQLNMSSAVDDAAAQIALIHSRVILEPVVKQLGLSMTVHPHRPSMIQRFFSAQTDAQLTIDPLIVPAAYYNQHLNLTAIDASHYSLSNTKGQLILQGTIGKLATNANGFAITVTKMKAHRGTMFDIVKQSNTNVMQGILSRLQITELGDSNSQTGILQINLKDTDPVRLVTILNAITKTIQENDKERKALETAMTLDFLNQQLPIVKSSLEEAESALNHYRSISGKLDLRIEAQQLIQSVANVDKQISGANLTKADLLQKFTQKHPMIIGIDDKIKQLQKLKMSLIKQVKALPAADQKAVSLMRDVKVKNNLYLILLSKIQELRVVKAGTLSDIRILATAVPPEAPLSKQSGIVILASATLGLILGCLIVLMRKAFFRYVSDPHWTEKQFNLVSLAIVPYSKFQSKNMANFKLKKTAHLDILAEKNPRDLCIEALRSLRTSFQIMLAESRNNIITVMGISQSIGKSFISVNFSYLLADSGKRVLLIDGDIRKGHMHDYFKAKRSPGLSELLANNATLDEVIHKTSVPHLSFISCGNYPENPAELLMRKSFNELIKTVSQQYDLVVIDTSPILAVTDSAIIGAVSGLNLLVIGSDTHQTEEIKYALKRLETAEVKVHGTIFNNLKPETAVNGNLRYNYYYEYGH